MPKFRVFFTESRLGYIDVEAEDEQGADDVASSAPYEGIAWLDDSNLESTSVRRLDDKGKVIHS